MGKLSRMSQKYYQGELCPYCGHSFTPGEIDDHISECAPVLVRSVGTMEDVADLEESDGIKCKF